jgi:uncharacterized membrane protein YfcA
MTSSAPRAPASGFLQYWKNPALDINLVAVICIAIAFVAGGFFGARWANQLDPLLVRKFFALFIIVTGVYLLLKR